MPVVRSGRKAGIPRGLPLWRLVAELMLRWDKGDRGNFPFESRVKVRPPWAAKIDRMRDRGDAVHPPACHAQDAIPRFDREA